MADTKQTKTIGEHHVCAVLARQGWAPALTRDGLERTDILAVQTHGERPMIEVQVKSARGRAPKCNWMLGIKSQQPAVSDREWSVLVAIDPDPSAPLRSFVVPRDHVAAAAWISHVDWLTDPATPAGKRKAQVEKSRVLLPILAAYEDRWDLLPTPTSKVSVLLPSLYRDLAIDPRVRLPAGHPWRAHVPTW